MTAQEIVEAMLTDRIEEARRGGYVRVFGPDIPDKGYFFAGADPLGEFIKNQVKDANPTTTAERNRMLKHLTDQGFVIWQKKGSDIYVFHHPNVPAFNLSPDGLKALEQTLGLNQRSVIFDNKKPIPAGQVLYAQSQGGQQAGAAQQARTTPAAVAQKKNMTLTATFGGLQAPTGSFQPVYKVNHREIQKGLKSGFAFVLKYPNGGFNVVIPKGYRFSQQAIRGLEQQMGLKPSTLVQLFVDNISHGKAVAASVAIYGQAPGGAPRTP